MNETLKRLLILDAACCLAESHIDHRALTALQDAVDLALEPHFDEKDFESFERLQKKAVADLDKNPHLFGFSLEPLLQEEKYKN